MQRILLFLLIFINAITARAGKVTGLVTDADGKPLAYASVTVKGTGLGTTSNSAGNFSISLSPGEYVVQCQYVGYGRAEKKITVTDKVLSVDFILVSQPLTLSEVIAKTGEDPAYEIIRQAIRKRSYYNNQVDSLSVEVYIKGVLKSRGLPTKIFGKPVERDKNDGLDSAGKGILFLSESVTQVDVSKPNKIKFHVISSRESGGGYGLSFPFFINFYENNVSVFDNNLNPRGFVSPIADGALNYYKYHYEGSFIEDGKMINTIKVTPRRRNEPLFTGTLQITEDDWRIYSVDLLVTKNYQLELLDTLHVKQLHAQVAVDTWKTTNQLLSMSAKQFGASISGEFVNVYRNYNINPGFDKKYFGRTIMKYDTAFNHRDSNYWSAIRPFALEADEQRDFIFKDSISRVRRDSAGTRRSLDSLRKNQKPVTVKGILWSGQSHSFYGKHSTVTWQLKPLITQLEYNTVEGLSAKINQSFTLTRPNTKYTYQLDWKTRYGFSNTHLNSFADLTMRPTTNGYRNRYLRLSGGKRLSQFNQDDPINAFTNTVYTLLLNRNYMKLYENWFGRIEYNNKFDNGVVLNLHSAFEDRLPVENSTDYSFSNRKRPFTANHPEELAHIDFQKHQALTAGISLSWQPGQHYIEFPWGKMPIGSNAPVFTIAYEKGINKLLGSDIKFDKWKFTVADNINFKLKGEFKYRVGVGGFLNRDSVGIPDLTHFNGNRTFYNIKYLNSFQIAPYYKYSNSETFYAFGHAEHHFNGLLTNKIPFLNKMKWNLVAGANTFFVDRKNYYAEAFVGLENIFKLFRVDFVNAYQPGEGNRFGVRLGFGGLLGGKFQFNP